MKQVINKISQEIWYCRNFNDTTLIEGVEFVKVFKAGKSEVLMNKASLTEVITNEMVYNEQMQING